MFKIIISPAKRMIRDVDTLAPTGTPAKELMETTKSIMRCLKRASYYELKEFWGCSEKIGRIYYEQMKHADLADNLTPALLSYQGSQYQYMAPGVFDDSQWDYVQEHLRILSAVYGVLKPLDGVTPCRLDMKAKIHVNGTRDLYYFWGRKIYESLAEETDCIINLASAEYSRCITEYLEPSMRFVTCLFGELIEGRFLQKGTRAKIARGEIVRYMAENKIEDPEELKNFDRLGYCFIPERSDENTFVFINRVWG